MIFQDPAWLALLPVVALAGWVWRDLQILQRPLRAGFVLLVILLLMRPQRQTTSGGMDLWVLLDRSASTGDAVDKGLPEWRSLLEKAKPHRDDRIHFVDYATETVLQDLNAGGPYTGSRTQTRTAQAVEHVLALRQADRSSRILVFSDGFSTEPLTGLPEKLTRAGVPLDLRLLPNSMGDDFRLRMLQVPPRAQVSEPCLIQVEVSGPVDGPVPLTIFRNGQKMTDSQVMITAGRGTARFTDRVDRTGAFKYEAEIQPANDAHRGNNRYEAWIEITGGPRLLLVTAYPNDPLEAVLAGQGFQVETVRDPAKLLAGQLTGCRGVILNNVPAWEMPADFLASLNFFVTAQGGGLLMAGGRQSFGAGGYFRSSIDGLLPVSMELKKDQKKLAAAIVTIMDRSGSMAAPAGGGTKMDLANEGSARSIELLGFQDMAGVFAVDSEAHEVVPLQQIASPANRQVMQDKIRRVNSGGGGIFVYNGLKAGWDVLKTTAYGTRHMILFADAADAEQPEEYVRLLEEVTAEGGTVSVIALGTAADSDAAFLKDVAARGNGRIFFTDRADDLPNVFTAETVAVARSAFVREPVPTGAGGLWAEIAGRPLDWLPEVDGYNLGYLRDWASQGLVSKDEYAAPLVAWGQRGSGRTAAVTFPLGGEYSDRVRAWPQYADFARTMARWLMGPPLPPGLGLRAEVTGTQLTLDLLYDGPLWTGIFAGKAPSILLAQGIRADAPTELTWQRMSPGRYQASVSLEEGAVVRGGIQAGTHILPFGPVSVGTQSEWSFDPVRQEELRQIVLASGGQELSDLATAWQSPPTAAFRDLRPWLIPMLLLLLLADALVTRLNWKFPLPSLLLKFRAITARPARGGSSEHSPRDITAPLIPAANEALSKTASINLSPSANPAAPAPLTAPPVPAAVSTLDSNPEEARRRARFARAKKKS